MIHVSYKQINFEKLKNISKFLYSWNLQNVTNNFDHNIISYFEIFNQDNYQLPRKIILHFIQKTK